MQQKARKLLLGTQRFGGVDAKYACKKADYSDYFAPVAPPSIHRPGDRLQFQLMLLAVLWPSKATLKPNLQPQHAKSVLLYRKDVLPPCGLVQSARFPVHERLGSSVLLVQGRVESARVAVARVAVARVASAKVAVARVAVAWVAVARVAVARVAVAGVAVARVAVAGLSLPPSPCRV